MDQVLLILQVDDYERWKRVAEEGAGTRKIMGSKEAFVFRNANNQDEVVILYQWDNLDNAKNFFESPDLKAKMEKCRSQGNARCSFP